MIIEIKGKKHWVYFFGCSAPTVGTDNYDIAIFPKEPTEDDLCELGNSLAWENAESYGYYAADDEENEDDCAVHYGDGVDFWYEPYSPKEHDGNSMSGSWWSEILRQIGDD